MPAIFQIAGVHLETSGLWQRGKERSIISAIDVPINLQINRFEDAWIFPNFDLDWNRVRQNAVGEFVLPKNFKPGSILLVRDRFARR